MSTASTTLSPAAQLGPTLGYRFFGDSVELNATFHLVHRMAHDLTWALQLWACPSNPTFSQDLAGHLVAEAPIPPMAEIADTGENFVTVTSAQPPAGDRDYSMVLVLIARRGPAFDGIHDLASFPMRERFVLPRFAGPVAYRFEPGQVHLTVGRVENPRAEDNLSGTISLELWALPDPYVGGRFAGVSLAGTTVGTLAGQTSLENLAFELPSAELPVGTWHLVAMVREWTGDWYTTRDFVNLGPIVVPVPVVELPPRATAVVVPPPAPVVAAPVCSTSTPAEPVTAPARKSRAARPVASVKVSVNTATAAELAAVKGLPRPVAERLAQERPFKSLDELTRVKGVGDKLLAKVRAQLKV